MAFILTGGCILFLFGIAVYFVRQGEREARDQEEHPAPRSIHAERRTGIERRSGRDRRHNDLLLSR